MGLSWEWWLPKTQKTETWGTRVERPTWAPRPCLKIIINKKETIGLDFMGYWLFTPNSIDELRQKDMQSLHSIFSLHSLPQASLDSHTTQMLKKWPGYLHQLSFIWPRPHQLPLNCGNKATWWTHHSTANPPTSLGGSCYCLLHKRSYCFPDSKCYTISKWQNWALRDSSSNVDWASLIWNLKSKMIPNPKLSELQ